MKTTQEKADQLRAMLDMPKFLQRLDVEDVRALLDDADELARLREGLDKEIKCLLDPRSKGEVTAERVARRLQALLNDGDGDGGNNG